MNLAAALLSAAVFAFAGLVEPINPDPEEPVVEECGGHAHLHSNAQHKRFVKRLYNNPWLPKKARVKNAHMLACAEEGDAKLMRKRWRVAKSPSRGVPIANWATWVRVGRCEQPGPGRWGVNWSFGPATYEGGLGFYASSWDAFKLKGYPSSAAYATWRQQMRTADNLWRSVGWGWGCGG